MHPITASLLLLLALLAVTSARADYTQCDSTFNEWFPADSNCKTHSDASEPGITALLNNLTALDNSYEACGGDTANYNGANWTDFDTVCGPDPLLCTTDVCNALVTQKAATLAAFCPATASYGRLAADCAVIAGGTDCYDKLVHYCEVQNVDEAAGVYGVSQTVFNDHCAGMSTCAAVFPPPTSSPTTSPTKPTASPATPTSTASLTSSLASSCLAVAMLTVITTTRFSTP